MGQAIDAKKMNKVIRMFDGLKDIKPDWISEEEFRAIRAIRKQVLEESKNEIDRQNSNI